MKVRSWKVAWLTGLVMLGSMGLMGPNVPGAMQLQAQDLPSVIVDVNFDVLHKVGDQDSMDRSRFITIHSNPDERDWDGTNFTPDLRDHFLNGYDVYTGRTTGGITWTLNWNAVEDPARPGHVIPSNIQALGTNSRNSYAGKTWIHPYEHRHNLVLCAQFHPFYPDGTKTTDNHIRDGWALSQSDTPEDPFGSATGEYMGLYAKNFFGGNGPQRPYCIEIINEPLWELVTNGTTPPSECFKFHNNVATEIRKYTPDIPIGGYAAAFPDFDKDNFQRWHDRDKLFMDMSGEYMDFVAWHLYDFPVKGGKEKYRKGSNMEATFDMQEQYSMMTLGKVLPFEISEYGAQTHDYNNQGWTAYRDWLRLKSITPMLMSFLERPDKMLMTIPFTVVKAEWGRSGDIPYGPRLMRQAFEKAGETGDHWVYTEQVLFYQLWSDVKGKRVDSHATDQDFLCDAYVDGNKAYVIVNNLEFAPRAVGVNPAWAENKTLESLEVKQVFLKNNYPVLETTQYTEPPASIVLGSEAAMVLKYTFTEALSIPDTSLERKYYATDYLKEIQASTEISFEINDIDPGAMGEAVLRLGIGRDHGQSLQPTLLFNGTPVEVPADFRGGPQTDRDNFFGVIEVPVPHELLQTNNQLSLTFAETGGHVSSVALQVFEQSKELFRSDTPDIFNMHIYVTDELTGNAIPGAEVAFQDESYLSDSEGHVLLDSLEQGTYGFSVSVEGYEEYTREPFELKNNAHLYVKMEPLSYTVDFLVRESELQVPVSNVQVDAGGSYGTTNAEGSTSLTLPLGINSIMLSRDYFESYSEEAEITSDTLLELDILRLLADAKFRISDELSGGRLGSATVELDGTSITTNTLGLATFRGLEVNHSYPYTVSRDGYQSFADELVLKTDSTIEISIMVGMHPTGDLQGLRLYPVPARDLLQVEWNQEHSCDMEIRVNDLDGRTHLSQSVSANAGGNFTELELDLSPGIYILILRTTKGSLHRKFIIQ